MGPHHHRNARLSETELRVKALESLLAEKGLVDAEALDVLIDTYERQVGPRNGARVVARAWVDAEYKRRAAWRRAAERTPHGEPIELDRLAREGDA